jgi:3-dehydroquinate synthase
LKTIYVELRDRRYPVFVGQGLLGDAGSLLRRCGFDSAPIIITNRRVFRLHGPAIVKSLGRVFGRAPVIRIGDGERYKDHSTLLKIYEELFRVHADRRSWILAFGGGVVGDIAGYAAATFMRGIPWVMVPTTLLSQVDSSVGGKVGINVAQGKNLIGAFHQPAAVLSDTGALRTLPKRELRSGLYEVVKSAAIRSEPLLRYLERRLPGVLSVGSREIEHVVMEAVRIKAAVVQSDEKESGLRMILNYGHTIGHALEAVTDYKRFKHGEAVGWGMIAALEYGSELGLLGVEDTEELIRLILQIGPLPSLRGISVAGLWDSLMLDKKFNSADIRMIFLRQLGKAEICTGIAPASLRSFLDRLLRSSIRNSKFEIPDWK